MEKKAWIVSVNMGYGHQRTTFPLKGLAPNGEIICANDYRGIPKGDRLTWEEIRKLYEFISNIKRVPLIGNPLFFLFDHLQTILSFYPKKGESQPNIQLRQTFSLIRRGWGRRLIKKLAAQPLPLISSFFTPAFMAEVFNYPGEIFCIICDADIARTWVSLNPQKSKIKYFVPNTRVVERLKLYGVKSENIFFTGYPLPLDIIGNENMEILKEDLRCRLVNLDSQKRYFDKYGILIEKHLGSCPKNYDRPLTILFSVGGAGAQKEIGIRIVESLMNKIKKNEAKIILSAGIKEKIKDYFERRVSELGLKRSKNIEIIFNKNIEDYFQAFNNALRKTDVLWTKPSELSFYSALGLPIIIAPPIGSQEEFNMRWLLKSGFGFMQEDLAYIEQWLFDWRDQGYLAEAAMQGFIEGEKLGALNIKKIISGEKI